MIQPMEIDDMDYESMNQAKGLHNIFEEEYNTHLPWNEMCIYDLNWQTKSKIDIYRVSSVENYFNNIVINPTLDLLI